MEKWSTDLYKDLQGRKDIMKIIKTEVALPEVTRDERRVRVRPQYSDKWVCTKKMKELEQVKLAEGK